MEKNMVRLDTISDFSSYFSAETLHPSVFVADISDTDGRNLLELGAYTVLFKEHTCSSCFGRKDYDFPDGTLACISPGQTLNIGAWAGSRDGRCLLLCFHPDLVYQTGLGRRFGCYTFFRYRQNEALHLSCREKIIVKACMEGISDELCWGVDEFSRTLLGNRIELLLNCCARFYRRQFITRHDANEDMIDRAGRLLENYCLTGQVRCHGLPGAGYFSRMLGLSPAYFEDMLRHETGKSTGEFVSLRRIAIARDQLCRTCKSPAWIAEELGFTSVRSFNMIFKRLSGHSPDEYRAMQAAQ